VRTGDTIVANAAAPGHAPRTVIRLSGPGSLTLLRADLEPPEPPPPNTIRPARLRLPALPGSDQHAGVRTLPVLLGAFAAQRSYTGEDVLELQCPAHPALVERIEALCVARGARPSEPGEFTARAYLNDRLTLDQAEGVHALVGAASEAQLLAARRLAAGDVGDRWRALADRLSRALALVEAGIDFTDQEDVVPIAPAELARELEALVGALQAELGASGETERAEPRVVLAGVPNAGKSTLFNALRRAANPRSHDRAVASAEAGSTRDALVEPLDLSRLAPGSGVILWTDLPGLDATPTTPGERAAQHAAREALAHADVVIHCDPHGRFSPIPGTPEHAPTLRVRTKADLVHPHTEVEEPDSFSVCAIDGYGLGALARAIADSAFTRPGGVVSARARRAIDGALGELRGAREAIDPSAPALGTPELVAGAMRGALDRLGELAGRVTPDDVLARVFATFCVGK